MLPPVTTASSRPDAVVRPKMPCAYAPAPVRFVLMSVEDTRRETSPVPPVCDAPMPRDDCPAVVIVFERDSMRMSPSPAWNASMPLSWSAVVSMARPEASIPMSSVEGSSSLHRMRSPAAGVSLHTAVVCACAAAANARAATATTPATSPAARAVTGKRADAASSIA